MLTLGRFSQNTMLLGSIGRMSVCSIKWDRGEIMATPYSIIEMAAMKLNLEFCLAVAISEF